MAMYSNRVSSSAMSRKNADQGLVVVETYHDPWIGLYDHQLLIWPRLIHKLRMKTRARCCCWGHYRDPTTHFSTSLSQLLQRNPIDGFQFSFQWCFSWTSQPVCQPVARVARKKPGKVAWKRFSGNLQPQYSPEGSRNTHQKPTKR